MISFVCYDGLWTLDFVEADQHINSKVRSLL